jgi:SAM-dependent methyltransferase
MFVNESNGHKFGNFHSYYTFHEQQSRTKLIPPNFFATLWQAQGCPATFSIIDIGCNEGNLTLEVYDRAIAELPSHVCCLVLGIDLDSDLIARACAKSCDIPNVYFYTVDIMSEDGIAGVNLIKSYCLEKGIDGFSFASLFSITMWIHLNHGDVGFEKFLNISSRLLTNVRCSCNIVLPSNTIYLHLT